MTPSFPGDKLISIAKFKQIVKNNAVLLKMETDAGAPSRASPEFWLKLPKQCSEADIKLKVSKETEPDDDFAYYLTFSRAVKYSGKNYNLSNLCTGFNIGFSNWDQLLIFIDGLPNNNPSKGATEAMSVTEIHSKSPVRSVPLGLFDEAEIKVPKEVDVVPDAKQLEKYLRKTIFGQDYAIKVISYQVATQLARKNKSKPTSILAFGDSGTGKTRTGEQLGKALKELCFPGYDTVVIQMNTLTEAFSVSRLIGADPNYVGFDQKALLEAVQDNPHVLFILDEIEKAHPEVIKIFMSILDEGKLATRKEMKDGSHELDFKNCVFFFTSNLNLNSNTGSKMGFRLDDKIEKMDCSDKGVDVKYTSGTDHLSFVQQIYRDNEKARDAFIRTGVLKEIASRFDCFIEFKVLTNNAKLHILAKTILDTAYEYGIRITRIETGIMQELVDASSREKALTVRSFRVVVNGYLAPVFMATSGQSGADVAEYKLDGTLADPQLIPV